MRIKIGEHGIGGNNESWYWLEFNPETGELFHVHEWHNMNHRMKVDEGEVRTLLHEAKGKNHFSDAIEVIKVRLFHAKP